MQIVICVMKHFLKIGKLFNFLFKGCKSTRWHKFQHKIRGSTVPLPSKELIISILTKFDHVCVPKYRISCNTVWNYVSCESGMS